MSPVLDEERVREITQNGTVVRVVLERCGRQARRVHIAAITSFSGAFGASPVCMIYVSERFESAQQSVSRPVHLLTGMAYIEWLRDEFLPPISRRDLYVHVPDEVRWLPKKFWKAKPRAWHDPEPNIAFLYQEEATHQISCAFPILLIEYAYVQAALERLEVTSIFQGEGEAMRSALLRRWEGFMWAQEREILPAIGF